MAPKNLWNLCLVVPLLCASVFCQEPIHQPNSQIATYRHNAIRMLNDLIHHEAVPSNLFLLTCWSVAENIAARKMLGSSITFLKNAHSEPLMEPLSINVNRVVFVLDLECSWPTGWLNQVNASYFGFPFRWVVLSPNEVVDDEQWKGVSILVDSHLTLVTWSSAQMSFKLEELYKDSIDSGTVIHEPFGSWSSLNTKRLVDDRTTRILSRRRRDLHKSPLQASVVILNNDTLNHLEDYVDKHIDSMTKCNFIVVRALMDIMNVTQQFKYVDTWGYVNPETKKINGMLGDILDGVSVIGGTSLFLVEDRVAVFDYVSMVVPTKTRFIFRAPPLSNVANIYYLPFDGKVWLCSGALVFVACLAIYISYWGSSKSAGDDEQTVRGTDVVLLGVGAIAQMGSSLEARVLSGRISTIFFFIFLLFMYTSYTANIVSLLQATTKSIRTLEDLYNSKLDYGVEDTPYNRWYFPNTVGQMRRAIYEQKIAPPKQSPKFINATYGMYMLRKGMFTFHTELGPAYKIVEETFFEHEKCGLIEMDYLGVLEPWMIIRKRSPYKEIIKINLFKIREHGVQMREVNRIYTKKPICTAGGQSFQSVRLVDCYIVLKVLGAGCVLSLFIFCMEICLHRRAKRIGAVCLF